MGPYYLRMELESRIMKVNGAVSDGNFDNLISKVFCGRIL